MVCTERSESLRCIIAEVVRRVAGIPDRAECRNGINRDINVIELAECRLPLGWSIIRRGPSGSQRWSEAGEASRFESEVGADGLFRALARF
jgi:hypothetical protein